MDLVTPGAWQTTDATADPWAEHRPDPVGCDEDQGLVAEDGGFEVDTGLCAYASLRQPSLIGVQAGESLDLVVYHNLLWSEETDAEAHLVVALGDEVLVEEHIPIPAEAEVAQYDLVAAQDHVEGEDVWFHLHNHGANTWIFVHLQEAR